ncbi:MAG: hypothetical protein ACJ8C4_05455 [Gemmataceae bacterium]
MKRFFRFSAITVIVLVLAVSLCWSWAQCTEDAVSETNFARITEGMTISEVRAILGQESMMAFWMGDGVRVGWEGRNRTVSVFFPKNTPNNLESKEIVADNCVARCTKRRVNDAVDWFNSFAMFAMPCPNPPTPVVTTIDVAVPQ